MSVLQEIDYERRRQWAVKGWTPEHDDTYAGEELALAASAYALPSDVFNRLSAHGFEIWPFEGQPTRKDRRRDLVRAAALLVAEIERIDRRDSKTEASP